MGEWNISRKHRGRRAHLAYKPRNLHVDRRHLRNRFLDVDFARLATRVHEALLDFAQVLLGLRRVRGAQRPQVLERHVVLDPGTLLRPVPYRDQARLRVRRAFLNWEQTQV